MADRENAPNHNGRELPDLRISKRRAHNERDCQKGNSWYGLGQTESSVRLGRSLATILMVTGALRRVAMHLVTALHCLFGRAQTDALAIRRDGNSQRRDRNPLRRSHRHQPSQYRRVALRELVNSVS